MEEKPAASSAGADSPASAEPGSRRRAGGQKRKANAVSSSSGGSSSAPSKRLTREKAAAAAAAAAAMSYPLIHNGPLTRARQGPNYSSSSFPSPAAGGVKAEEKAAEVARAAEEEERNKLEELETAMEAEFEAIRSRDSNAHVVPSHCGWFSWTKVHPVEERSLPSFFNGKSQIRTPYTYLEIRNWIVNKFHANPKTLIESKDLAELEVADVDTRQEVLEFLDYWGLINFHPFPQVDSAPNTDGDGTEKDSLLEKLFHFEAIQPCQPVVPKPNIATPAVPSRLFPESAIAEELVRPEGPGGVEYHCNSCSADCSRKRYHCQKQADYDLCVDCFNDGKFGSNLFSSDFILMESAEAPGVSGGTWTDQETLLLLEALELFKENWNEIAEHVATKTKAQCMLHFIQMPIEDAFFNCNDEIDGSAKDTADPATTLDNTTAPKDVPETSEEKASAKKDQPPLSAGEALNPEDASEVKVCPETSKPDNIGEAITSQEVSNVVGTSEAKVEQEPGENIALQALREAFEAVGYLPTPENRLSFAEVGNPVMALASFLARVVGPVVATASARSSLKSLSSGSPGMQLATRHCFVLEDPPAERKDQNVNDCDAAGKGDQEAQKDYQGAENQKGNTSVSDNEKLLNEKKIEDSALEEKKPPDSSNSESTLKVGAASGLQSAVTGEEVEPVTLKESNNSELVKDQSLSNVKESDKIVSDSENPSESMKELQAESSSKEYSQLTDVAKGVGKLSDTKSLEKNEPSQLLSSMEVEESSHAAETSKDVDKVPDSQPPERNEPQQPVKSNSVGENSQPTEASKDVDMLSSLASEEEHQQPNVANSVTENGAAAAEEHKNIETEKPESKEIRDDHNTNRLKRAAASALSAAAVKAKILANQEEDQIRQLAASLIEKQLHKLEMKLAFFNDMDGLTMRMREQLERSRQRLYHERAQIIAARLGLPPSSSRAMPPSLPTNRIATNFANSVPRPPTTLLSQRPAISRPMGTPTPSIPFVSNPTGNAIRPSGQDKLSSIETK